MCDATLSLESGGCLVSLKDNKNNTKYVTVTKFLHFSSSSAVLGFLRNMLKVSKYLLISLGI